MKIKVEKKLFDKSVRQFTTKGKLKRADTDRSNVNFMHIEAKDNKIKISGRKKNAKIMVRGILDGEVIEEGTFQISDIDSFMDELKGLTGKFYEFDFGDSIKVKCGKNYQFPYHLNPADAALLTKLVGWNETNYKADDTIKFEVSGKTYTFNKWFSISESSELNSIPNDLFNRTKVDKFNMVVDKDVLKILAENLEDKRSYDSDIEIKSFNDVSYELGDDIFPLLSSLSGPATFYTYLTEKGSVKVWVECNGIDWQITYKG